MALEFITRYQSLRREGEVTTYFAPLPYLQVRTKRYIGMRHSVERAVCLVWLFWSVRYSWTTYHHVH